MRKYPLSKKVRVIAFVFGLIFFATTILLFIKVPDDISIWELLGMGAASSFLIYCSIKGESPIWAEDGPLIWWAERKNIKNGKSGKRGHP